MTSEIKVRDYKTADDSDLRSMEVKLAEDYIKTPVKAVVTKDFFRDTNLTFELSKLSEHFLRFDEDSLNSYYYVNQITNKRNNDFSKHKAKVGKNTTTLTIVEFKNKGDTVRIPTDDEIKALITSSYALSDIAIIPSIPKFSRSINLDNFDIFLGYLNFCLERIGVHNKKKIMGYIPMVAPAFLEIIVDFYLDNGINALYLDFDGTTLNTNLTQIDVIKRTIANRGYEENNFLHYVNISYGKAINETGVLSARDLLSFGHGLDSLGGIHVAPKRGQKFYEWLKKHKDVTENSTRILNKSDYGYYRYKEGIDIRDIYPQDALYSFNHINEKEAFSTKKKLFNIVNIQQQMLEASKLRTIVKEESNKTIPYFSSKRCVKDVDIEQLKKHHI